MNEPEWDCHSGAGLIRVPPLDKAMEPPPEEVPALMAHACGLPPEFWDYTDEEYEAADFAYGPDWTY